MKVSASDSPLAAPENTELLNKSRESGLTLVEVVVATAIMIMLGVSAVTCLMQCQSFATKARLLTSARAIVQRNIDACSGIAFTGTTTITGSTGSNCILATTGSGVVCCDTGGAGPENVFVLSSSNVLVNGTLQKIVTNEPVIVTGSLADASVTVQRVTFQINYNYLGTPYTFSETTLRSADTQ